MPNRNATAVYYVQTVSGSMTIATIRSNGMMDAAKRLGTFLGGRILATADTDRGNLKVSINTTDMGVVEYVIVWIRDL